MAENCTQNEPLVSTIKERCRVCFTCVRECPVKAIRIYNGQSEVIQERCIACGNCVKVCSQEAKVFLQSIDKVKEALAKDKKVVACIAPSFPAEFDDFEDYKVLIGTIKALGFYKVVEIAFGADIVADEYNKILKSSDKPTISSDCPAIVNYIENYHPNLINTLMPVLSPMGVSAKVLRKKYGDDITLVFIGPCIAKKAESEDLDIVITFSELRDILNSKEINNCKVVPQEFDPPIAGKGAIFPVTRGLYQNIDLDEEHKEEAIIVAEGKTGFREVIEEFEKGELSINHLELLCCEGCIMGPGINHKAGRYSKRARVSKYVKGKLVNLDKSKWTKEKESFKNLDFTRKFTKHDSRLINPSEQAVKNVLESMNKYQPQDHLNCGACGYETCVEHAMAITQGLAENEMCLPYTIELLHNSISDLNASNKELAGAKEALKQSEKLASMGQLSAGIAHELNNPLGVITMYSNILKDEADKDDPIREDLELIAAQADRCKKIVGGLLNFARKNQVKLAEVNFEDFVNESFKSIIKKDTVKIEFKSLMSNPNIEIDLDQMMQVLTNLEKNAIESMPDGGTLSIELSDIEDDITLKINDTGCGIPKENMDKIFTPFFTTKELGKGTGLGLPLIYGIIKMHKGSIKIESNTDINEGPLGTLFIIKLPRTKTING
jgi:iron only hydrogenase large subunit-like protein